MLSKSQIAKIVAAMGIIAWLILVLTDMVNIYQGGAGSLFGFSGFFSRSILILLFLLSFAFYHLTVGKGDVTNINDLIWKVFVTGLVATIGSLVSRYLLMIAQYKPAMMNKLLIHTIYDINTGLLIIFLTSTYVVWKKLILYQKSKYLLRLWSTFEVIIIISLVFTFTNYHIFDTLFNILLGVLVLFSIVLSVNLKWVAYLNFKQKWKSILLIGLVVLYIWYYFITISDFSNRFSLSLNLVDNVTVLALFIFNIIYSAFSILVLLFNLPTSSVFEQKLEEVINFQKLSQSANTKLDEEQIYEILLESSISAVLATGAWMEIFDNESHDQKVLYHRITKQKKDKLKADIKSHSKERSFLSNPIKSVRKSSSIINLKDEEFRSALLLPIYVQGKEYGELCLMKDLPDGFNKEMVELINSFINQASISIENHELIKEAIENERYKEELEIAKKVQGSLLPDELDRNDDFEIVAYSKAAAEVGGDYYDTYRINEYKVAVIIGDVSGKGTSAAFHMSQMKGIFQSLSQLDLPVNDFFVKANKAISKCLDKKSLITASYYVIDQKTKTVTFSRAGHCPTLYFKAKEQKPVFFETTGMGLGILRNEKFEDYVTINSVKYSKGDIILLYTDGITEAKNKSGEEYGYDRLAAHLEAFAEYPLSETQEKLIQQVYDFCGYQTPDDDFTTVLIKFI